MIQSVTRCFCVFLFLAWPLTITLYAQKEIRFDVLSPNTNSSSSPVPKSTVYELSITTQVVQNANCNQNGIISAQAKDGLPPYEYQILKAIPPGSSPIPPPPPTPSGTWVTSNIFNVEEGTYLIIVRDQLGMEASTTQTLIKDSVPKVQFALENSCVPEGTFEIVIEATNPGISPYFLSSNGSVFEPISLPLTLYNQNSGDYNMIIKDSNGCENRQTILIYAPLVLSIKASIPPSCLSNNGIIELVANGGSSNLEYSLNGGLPTANPIFSNLSSGRYTARVEDKTTGCFDEIEIDVASATAVTGLKLIPTAVKCNGGNDGTIEAILDPSTLGTNDNPVYTYSIDNIHFQESNVFSGLAAGSYTVKVISGRGCVATDTIIITEPEPLVATLILKTPLYCDVQPLAELAVSGGAAQYTYSKDGSVYSNTLFDTSQQLAVGIGAYSFFVKDANGCVSKSNTVVIDSIPGLKIEVDETLAKINCKGDATATLTATAYGGLGTYRYSLLDEVGTTIRPVQSSGIFTLLAAGKYKIKVESGDCTPEVSRLITITEPAEKLSATFSVIDVLCAGATNGKIQISIVGGTADKMVAISPNLSQFVTTTLFDNLASGSYDVLVKDALGCFEKKTVTIQEPLALAIHTISSSIVQERCFDDKNAQFSIAISGGIKPYAVSLDRPTGPFEKGIATQTQFDFTNLSGGSHIVYIKDANNCYLEWNVILNESVKINPTTTVNYDCVNNAQHNLVTVNLDTSSTDFNLVQFALDGGIFQSSNLFSNLSPGDHFIRVKHNNGCSKDSPIFTIENIEPLTLTLKEGGLNEIIAVANGGGGNYKYAFNGEINGTNPSYGYSKTQDVLATVEDANGCTTSVTQKLNFIDVCTPNYFTPNGDGINDTWAPGCTQYFKNLTFLLFDRYGRELGNFQFGESWNGKYQGIELPSGDYWYVLKLNAATDDREFVGHFTLYR